MRRARRCSPRSPCASAAELEPLLTAFAAALLGGWADRSQRVAALLSARGRPGAVVVALIFAAAGNCVASAFAGSLLRREVSPHAATLLLAVALAFAGVAGLIGEAPKPPTRRGGPFLSSLAALVAAGWGDKTQYLVAALALYWNSFLPVAAAAWVAGVAVCLPAAVGGEAFVRAAPVKPLRILFGLLFLIAAAIVAVTALGLV
jgi:Ca2+/H+ antiporter, TMEM165/GDT1 family